jgi:hypothetical protein
VSYPKPVTVVINVTFVSSSFPLVAIDRHYQLEADPKRRNEGMAVGAFLIARRCVAVAITT